MTKYDESLAAERRRRAEAQLAGTPLAAWPESPPAGPAEQRVLPIDGTIAARYADWRRTPDGDLAWRWIIDRARALAEGGARRLSAKALVEECRARIHIPINNVFTPEIARELEERFGELRGLFELRRRAS